MQAELRLLPMKSVLNAQTQKKIVQIQKNNDKKDNE